MKVDEDKGMATKIQERTHLGMRLITIFGHIAGHRLVVPADSIPPLFRSGYFPIHQGEISFHHSPLAEHGSKATRTNGTVWERNDSSGIPVEPVQRARHE